MGGRIDIKPDNIAQLVDELRVIGKLELVDPVRLETMRAPDALDETRADIDGFRHHVAVQWVPSAADRSGRAPQHACPHFSNSGRTRTSRDVTLGSVSV
jgi:hypothetical protein